MSREHINNEGQFQSDKYPTTPPDVVPLKITDPFARDLLYKYADRLRIKGVSSFASDLVFRLDNTHDQWVKKRISGWKNDR